MFRIHVERLLNMDINTVFEAIADHARYDRFPGVSKSVLVEEGKEEKNGTGALVLKAEGEKTRVTWISEGHVRVPLLGRMMDRLAERSFSKAFSSLLKAIERRV
ncbi:SRPBCC family protein [Marinobacter shengliensis]|uniref:SRPBCC family protein n=1 Tax=Marinobacter shengliensis TaxID=1389223 RepID=UPI0025724280|nr:SRPBCC family protein [Marinobacter shengliensis]BEH15606.1 hypothetical protein MAALD49_29740 [Marinobacter shengliensis]